MWSEMSNYDRLNIDKALGFGKYDNNNKKHKNKKSKNNVRSPFRVQKWHV